MGLATACSTILKVYNKVLIIATLVLIFTYTRVFLFLFFPFFLREEKAEREREQLLHDSQELALFSKRGEERAHVSDCHVVYAGGHTVEGCRCSRGGQTR